MGSSTSPDRIRKHLSYPLAAVLLWMVDPFLTGPLRACPSCFKSADSGVVDAYLTSAVVLSLLPLGLIGLILYTVRRQLRRGGEPPGDEGDRHGPGREL